MPRMTYPATVPVGVPRQATIFEVFQQIGDAMRCRHADCTRRAHTSGWCTTHYRRFRAGQPMDAPIRRYMRIQEPADRTLKPADEKPVRRKRKRPFEAEWALLRELGLAE